MNLDNYAKTCYLSIKGVRWVRITLIESTIVMTKHIIVNSLADGIPFAIPVVIISITQALLRHNCDISGYFEIYGRNNRETSHALFRIHNPILDYTLVIISIDIAIAIQVFTNDHDWLNNSLLSKLTGLHDLMLIGLFGLSVALHLLFGWFYSIRVKGRHLRGLDVYLTELETGNTPIDARNAMDNLLIDSNYRISKFVVLFFMYFFIALYFIRPQLNF